MSLEAFRDYVEAVRTANPLADVVGADAQLTRTGRALMCSSPLRHDSDPSFAVYDDDRWYDFGTSSGGDVFSYVMARDRIDFRDAVDRLAVRAGLETWAGRRSDDAATREMAEALLERRWVAEIINEAADYYHRALPTFVRGWVREQYGFSDELIDEKRIGWADGGLYPYLNAEREIGVDRLIKTGLFVRTGQGPRDFFERRVMFPYYEQGLARYMIGRRVEGHTDDTDWERGKYKKQLTNSAKHDYVSKHVTHILYGLDSTKGRRDTLVITEGITDAITAQGAGFACVSPVTVSFRDEDVERLVEVSRRFERVVIFNDLLEASGAGAKGAAKTAGALFRAGIDARIVDLRSLGRGVRAALGVAGDSTDAKIDLNSLVREHGGESLHVAVAGALRYPEFLIERVPKNAAPGELADMLERVYEVVGACAELERDVWIDKICTRWRVSKRTVRNGVAPHVAEVASERAVTALATELFYGEVQEDERGFYFVRQGEVRVRVSNFALTPIERLVEEDGGERLSVWIDTVEGKRMGPHVMSRRAWRSKPDFIAELDRYPDLLWSGTNDNVQGVRGLVSRVEVPEIEAVSVVGRVRARKGGQELFVWPGGAMGADGMVEGCKVRWLGDEGPLSRGGLRLLATEVAGAEGQEWSEEEITGLMERAMPALFDLNEPEVVCSVLGWLYACADTPGIRAALGHFPLLWIWATHGAGKSTLMGILAQLVGLHGSPSSAGDTPFAMVRSLSDANCVPVLFDEYKGDMGARDRQRFERFARRVYSGETESRGRADQSVVSYVLERPMVIAGELPPTDPALLERLVVASPMKGALTAARADALTRLACEPLWRLGAPWYRFALGRPLRGDLAAARAILAGLETEAGLAGRVGHRLRDNLLVMILGLIRCEAWCESRGISLPNVLDAKIFMKIVATTTGAADFEDDEETLESFRPRTALDVLMREIRDLASAGILNDGVHYAMVEGELRIHLRLAYQVYLERRRASGQEDATNGILALLRAAREQSITLGGYVIERGKRTILGNSRIRCLAVDPKKLEDQTRIEPFPATTGRPWGGQPSNGW